MPWKMTDEQYKFLGVVQIFGQFNAGRKTHAIG